jgi:arsenate reductase-like glutaredoxin family protein
VLDAKKVQVTEERQSKKAPMSDADARKLLHSVTEVVLARGKAIRRLSSKEATLDDLRGPTGAFRAPMVRRGRKLLVGFSEEELKKLISGDR